MLHLINSRVECKQPLVRVLNDIVLLYVEDEFYNGFETHRLGDNYNAIQLAILQ